MPADPADDPTDEVIHPTGDRPGGTDTRSTTPTRDAGDSRSPGRPVSGGEPGAAARTSTTPVFAERLWVPWPWWLLAGLFAASLFLAVAFYLGWLAGLVAAGAIAVVVVPVFAGYGSAELLTLPDAFQAGRARLEWRYVGEVRALTAEETRLRRGRDADARAWLLVRPWLPRAVEITVEDPDDPAPYWLVGTRRPRALAEVLSAGADRARGVPSTEPRLG